MNNTKQTLINSRSGVLLRLLASFILLASLLVLPKAHAAVGDIFTDDNFKYTVLSEGGTDGTVSVAKQSDTVPSGAVTIPASVTQGSVTYSVTSIGAAAFGNLNTLESITIPGSVTSIGVAAFNKCNSLVNITIPDSVTSIGASAFSACAALKSVVIGDGVTNISANAFIGCSSLELVVFKGDAPEVKGNIFPSCPALETVYYVEGTSNWTNPWSFKTTASLKQEDIFIISSPMDQMVLPNANVSLEVSAFALSDLSYQWYKDGDAIEGATTPVYFIENAQGADSGSYTVTISNEYTSVSRETILDVLTRTGDPDSDFQYSISGGVVSIKRYLGSKKEVVIPNMIEGCLVTEISSMAFLNCFDITNVIIPDTVIYIGQDAFINCSELVRVKMSKRTTYIGVRAFSGCSKLTSITIPESVTNIGYDAFFSSINYSLKKVFFKGDLPAESTDFNWDSSSSTKFYYVEGKSGWETSGLNNLVPCKGEFWLDDIQYLYFSDQTATLFGYTGNPVNIEIPAKITVDSVDYQITSLGDIFFGCKSLKNVAVSMDMGDIYGEESGRIFEFRTFMNCNLDSIYFKGDSPWSFGATITGGFAATGNIYDTPLYYIAGTENWESPERDDPTMIACHNWTVADDILYLCNEDGTAIVKNYVGYPETITIPKTITVDAREYTVIAIDERAFYRCNSVKEISILADITGIESETFAFCTNLWSVKIADSVSTIGFGAFANCRNLLAVELGGTTEIADSAFYYCENLPEIILPEALEEIGSYAFLGCESLNPINIPDGVSYIGNYVFYGCDNLPPIFFSVGEKILIRYSPLNEGTAYTVPDTVTYIAGSAFSECNTLTDITIPESVTNIGVYAFSGCGSLTSIVIPESVTSMGYGTFHDCSALTNATIGNNVAEIPDEAFMGCSSLVSLVIPEGVTEIGSAAFYGCSSLTSVRIGNSVTSIGSWSFYNCSRLFSIILPESVTEIGDGAFCGCMGLRSIKIPENVTSIGSRAFNGCMFLTSINIPDGVTSIGSYTFYFCSSLKSINIPDSVTSIGSWAFSGCHKLASVTIGNSVTSIGEWAFQGCNSLTSIEFPESVTSIGGEAFNVCNNITAVYFRGDAPSMGGDVFNNCNALETIYYIEGTEGWTNPWQGIATATWAPGSEPTVPELAYAVEGGKFVLTFSGGSLEASSDLILWNRVEVTQEGKYEVDIPAVGKQFYRIAQ